MMKRLLLWATLLSTTLLSQQTKKPSAETSGVHFLGFMTASMISDDDLELAVTASSKWSNALGHPSAQFKVEMVPVRKSKPSAQYIPSTAAEKQSYITRISGCTVGIELHSSDGFLLGRVPLNTITTVDENHHEVGMSGNGFSEMKVAEYRDLVRGGDWQFYWKCR